MLKKSIFFLLFIMISTLSDAQVVINEMMANNQNTTLDSDGDASDWIELYNTSATSVNLLGWTLSDNPDSLNKWTFPSQALAAGGYIRIWCSGKNRLTPSYHTNFSIDAKGEVVYLTAPTGVVIDNVGPVYMPMEISFGRYFNGSNNLLYLSVATPGFSNNSATTFVGALQVEPSFSIKGGYFSDSIYVGITHPDPTVTIRYTTDGSEPNDQSPIYTTPILVKSRAGDPNNYSNIRTCYNMHFWLPDWLPPLGEVFKCTTLRACAFKAGYLRSPIQTESYFVDHGMFTRYGKLPVVSLVSDPQNLFSDTTGIYVPGINYVPGTFQANYYLNWKRPANIEYFLPDGSQAVNSNFEISINGVSSQSSPQKGLNVNASSDYGASKFHHPVFEQTKGKAKYITDFDKIKLRAWGSDRGKALFRDAYAASFMHRTDLDYEAYQPCVVFIDGEYWGLQEIRERNRNSSFYEEHYLNNKQLDIIDLQTMQPIEGSATNWNTLRSFILNNNMADSVNFSQVQSNIDLNSFLLHYVFSIYLSRGDWPDQNESVWRASDGTGKWKWIMWDMDNTAAYYLNPWYDMFQQALIGTRGYGPSDLLVAFLANTQFKYDFINIYCDWMNTSFLPTLMQQRVDSMKAELSPYMAEYQNRWQTNYNWNNQTDSIKWWVGLRPQNCRLQLQSNFQLPLSKRLGLQVSDTLKGNIQVNTIRLDRNTPRTSNYTFPWAGYYYPGVPVPLTATAKPGYRFLHWLPTMDTSRTIYVQMTSDTLLTAVFDVDPNYHPFLPIVINEVQTSNLLTIADSYLEYDDWLELYNPNQDTIDIAGYYLTDNLVLPTRFRFAEGSDSTKIPPYGHLLVWADNDVEQGLLHTNFKFNASGDLLVLLKPDAETVEDSLQIPAIGNDLSYGRSYDGSESWIVFTSTTPSTTNMEIPASSLTINELMSSNTSNMTDEFSEYNDWIELYNPSADTVDFSGWFISDDPARPNKFRFGFESDSLKIPPYGFKLLWADAQPLQGPLHLPFSLADAGGCVNLWKPDAVSLSDSLSYGAILSNLSYGSSYDGATDHVLFTTPTPRKTNQELPAGFLFINELLPINVNSVMDDFNEHESWIEIFNPGTDTMDLAGWFITNDAGYREKYRFPHGSPQTIVPPGAHLLLWADGQMAQGPLHLNFRLTATNGCVILYKPDDFTYGDVKCYTTISVDHALGRAYDGGYSWIDFSVPTPGAANWIFTAEQVFINEVQADNQSTVSDNVGEYEPWIELYNPNSDTLDLRGWLLTDDPALIDKYRLPFSSDSLKISPYGFLLLWADNNVSQGARHVGFRLPNSPSCVRLSKPEQSFVDSVCYSTMATDESFGRVNDGAPFWLSFSIPTPDSNNVDLSSEVVALTGSSFTVYPNPVHGEYLRFSRAISFRMYDMQGRQVIRALETLECSVNSLTTGIYLLRTDDNIQVRIIVQ